MSRQAMYTPGTHPDLSPPRMSIGVMGWVRSNLISSPLNVFLTMFSLSLIYLTIPPLIGWGIINADFIGTTRNDCTSDGACWVFIKVWFKVLMYGRYPEAELWRVNTTYVILFVGLAALMIPRVPKKGWISLFLVLVYPVLSYYLLVGDSFGLVWVESPLWGGLFLTLVIAISGIVASLPLGIVLALGRRSDMPIVRAVCIGFIEFWRGIPLITVLFMSSVMFPLFLPEGVNFDKLVRALVGVMLFSSAYMAEVVRGGLQAIPKGQFEAAEAMGFNYWKIMGLIILPQALKLVIPGVVNTFIGLFKDTTLVLIIGLFDLLGMAQLANTNPNWLGFSHEGYVFSAAVFWMFCFSMSRYSHHLEKKLHTGH